MNKLVKKPKAKLALTKVGARVRTPQGASPVEAKLHDPLETLRRETYMRKVCQLQRQAGQKLVG